MDPTYDVDTIKGNPEWHIAWILSEHCNDSAPMGWSRYVPAAKSIMRAMVVLPRGESMIVPESDISADVERLHAFLGDTDWEGAGESEILLSPPMVRAEALKHELHKLPDGQIVVATAPDPR